MSRIVRAAAIQISPSLVTMVWELPGKSVRPSARPPKKA